MPTMHAADGRDGYLLFSLFLQLPGPAGVACLSALISTFSHVYTEGLLVLRPLHYGADERQMSGMQTGAGLASRCFCVPENVLLQVRSA